MDMPIQVPIDDPNADTEWNDILRSHNILPPKPPSPTALIEETLLSAQAHAHSTRLDSKTATELSALEDDEDEDFLNQYRQKRMAELSALDRKSTHGRVYPLQKPNYEADVTEASSECWVLVLLTASAGAGAADGESRLMEGLWRRLAERFAEVKFCEIRAGMCIEGYPDRNTPTVLIYRNGEIRRQIVTLREVGGVRTGMEDWQRVLTEVGVLEEGDLRLRRREGEDDGGGEGRKKVDDDDDDDGWD